MIRKLTVRSIHTFLGRYIALLLIVALGTAFFAGLKVVKEAMGRACADYLRSRHFYDYRLYSSLGFNGADVRALESQRQNGKPFVLRAEGGYTLDALAETGGRTDAWFFLSLPKYVSKPSLKAGRMPRKSGECLADDEAFTKADLGKRIRIGKENRRGIRRQFRTRSFRIVGLSDSPLYLNDVRGASALGNGTLAGYFRTLGLPFVGCDVGASALGMDKYASKVVLKENGVPVLDGIIYTTADYGDIDGIIGGIEEKLGYPVIVKPVDLGSSVGISVAKNRMELVDSIDDAFTYAHRIIVEHAITQLREINCSVLGDENHAVASEIEEPLHTKDILSYEDKYLSGGNSKGGGSKGMAGVSRKIPAELPPEKREEVRQLAVRSFQTLGCSGVARIDFMIDEANGELYFNEINTIPGSLAFYLWEPLGIPYEELLDRLIRLALKRVREEEALTFSFDTNLLDQTSLSGSKSKLG